MKYKLINKTTAEETLCNKVTIDGFDYYVGDEIQLGANNVWVATNSRVFKFELHMAVIKSNMPRIIIATNNPNIDIPKVVDEVEMLAHKHFAKERFNWEQENPNGIKSPQSLIEHYNRTFTPIFRAGYNKSQETHPNSDDDVIEFSKWKDYNFYQHIEDNLYRTMQARPMYKVLENKSYTLIELLQLWKEQRIKTIYYE